MVKKVRDEDGSISLVDIGIKGIACQTLRNGMAQLTALKFLTTSYYHDVPTLRKGVTNIGSAVPSTVQCVPEKL